MRDRILLAQILIVPIIQLLILSNAATFEIRNTPIHVVDLDRTSTSRGPGQPPRGVWPLPDRRHDAVAGCGERAACCDGTVTMVVVIPHDFEASLVRTGVAPVQLSVNAEKGSAAGIVQSYAARILADYAAELTAAEAATPSPRSRHADTAARRAANRCARPQPVQPDAELQALHGARHPRGAGHDDRHAADGAEHRARERAGDAGAAERDADHARRVHHREAAAVLGARRCWSSRSD